MGLAGQRAPMYLILYHDWHMEELYEPFAVQGFAERAPGDVGETR
ncbi:hypothetical protein [Streptomyces sp. NPDC047803]